MLLVGFGTFSVIYCLVGLFTLTDTTNNLIIEIHKLKTDTNELWEEINQWGKTLLREDTDD